MGISVFLEYIYIYTHAHTHINVFLLLTDLDRIRFDTIKEPLIITAVQTVNSNKPVKYHDMAEINIAQFFCSAVIFNIHLSVIDS